MMNLKGVSVALSACLLVGTCCTAQKEIHISNYAEGWKGTLNNDETMEFHVTMKEVTNEGWTFQVDRASTSLMTKKFQLSDEGEFSFPVAPNIEAYGKFNEDGSYFTGFLRTPVRLMHMNFKTDDDGSMRWNWRPWQVKTFADPTVYLWVEEWEGNWELYPTFDDHRIGRMFSMDFKGKGDQYSWVDFNSGLEYACQLLEKKIALKVLLDGIELNSATLVPHQGDLPVGLNVHSTSGSAKMPALKENIEWPVATMRSIGMDVSKMEELSQKIIDTSYTATHSVLVAKGGKLVFEKYYAGFDESIAHDTRSAQKSMSSAMMGIAIDDGLIKSEYDLMYDYIDEKYQNTKDGDSLKASICLKDILTMSSGLDAVDWGVDHDSYATEDDFNNQAVPDWIEYVLGAPMLRAPGEEAWYGSANAFLVGAVVDHVVEEPLEYYMHRKLMAPLGIEEFMYYHDIKGVPYYGGGIFMRPRDMLKFGQLFLQKGNWNGEQLISEEWVKRSLGDYTYLRNYNNKDRYGYLWTHAKHQVGDKVIGSVDARGAGGQYISIVRELDAVIVITSGNYRNGRYWQPEEIIAKYVLPALLGVVNK